MKIKIYLVPHCHWDREWFHPEPTFQVLLEQQMQNLEKYQESYYNFDGHTWALDQYLTTNKLSKNLAQKIKQGQINFGPLYVQSDFYSSSFATLQTNINLGKKMTNQYSKLTDLIYVADSFGFPEQLPQIFKKNGFKKFVAWRGIKKEDQQYSNLATWQGIDGSKLRVSFMGDGYGIAVNKKGFGQGAEKYPYHLNDLEKDWKNVAKFKEAVIDPAVEACKKRRKQQVYWIPLGHDWSPVPLNLKQFVKIINELDDKHQYLIGNYQDYFQDVASLTAPTLSSNNLFYSGTSKIHRSIASNRYDLKKLYRECEWQIFYQMEQLEIIFHQMGGALYSNRFKETYIYKPLLTASAHDSLGGCNDDLTNQLALSRLIKIKKTIESYCDLMIRQIRHHLKLQKNDYLIFNPAPFEQDLLFMDRLSSNNKGGLSYYDQNNLVYTISTKNDSHPEPSLKCFNHHVVIKAAKMRPLSFRIIRLNNGKLTNAKTSNQKPLWPFDLVIDKNAGDEFDFSIDQNTIQKIYSYFHLVSNKQIDSLKIIQGYYQGEFQNITFKLFVTYLDDGINKIWQGKINNQLKNARIALSFKANKVKLSRQLAFIEQQKDYIPDWREKGYRDKPINHFTNDGLINLNNNLNILTKGTNEVEILEQQIFLVLARFSSHIGKTNLAFRPGVASGPPKLLATPDAQLQKELTFDLGFSTEPSVKVLNQWMFQGFGAQEGQVDYLNQTMDYFHLNPLSWKAQKIETPWINHSQLLIGLYHLKNKQIKYIVANPKNENNQLQPYEIDYSKY